MLLRSITFIVFVCSLPLPLAAQEPSNQGKLVFHVSDSQGEPLPFQLFLRDSVGGVHGNKQSPFWRGHSVAEGNLSLDVVPDDIGDYFWTIERGPEYRRISGRLNPSVGQTEQVNVDLERIANLRAEGWYSADMHVHRPVKDIELLMRAADLDFTPVITWWNTRGSSEGVKEPLQQFDDGRFYSVMAGEDEREGGALLYFGLDRPLDLKAKSREVPSPMKFVREARKLRSDVWIDIEKPFWWDVPTWLATEKMNSIGIANNHMCYREMLKNEAWGHPRDLERLPNPRGNGLWSQEIYYHALNSGLRIPPSAGSASGVLPNPVGYNRVYVHLEEPFSREAFFSALGAGRSFVTNGPLLRVRANHHWPGKVLNKKDGEALDVTLNVQLTSNDPIQMLEVIHNGQILDTISCSAEIDQQITRTIRVPDSGWFLIRAIADVGNTFRFASTAPWYVESPQIKTRISEPSARFFLNWVDERIDRLRETVMEPQDLKAVLEPHERARVFWSQQVTQANADRDRGPELVQSSSHTVGHLPPAPAVDVQPLLASVRRVVEAMEYIGNPLPADVVNQLQQLSTDQDPRVVTRRVEELLDPSCLLGVEIEAPWNTKVYSGNAERKLLEQGWRTFLVKVVNAPGNQNRLMFESPNAKPLPHANPEDVPSRWMQLAVYEGQPLKPNLSGLGLEYRIIQIYSRDVGPKEARLEVSLNRPEAEWGSLIGEWHFHKGTAGWEALNQIEIESRDGSLRVESTGNDPFMAVNVKRSRPAGVKPGGRKLLKFWAKSEASGIGQLFWATKERPQFSGDRQTNFLLEPGKEHLYEVEFHVDGELSAVRLDPLVDVGRMRIDWIELHDEVKVSGQTDFPLTFEAEPATPVTFRILDAYGKPGFAKFEIRDEDGRIYPAQSKRLAPDFFFQRHIYRGDGESISLPAGKYTIQCSRGPETIPKTRYLDVGEKPTEFVYRVERWVDPALEGWWSGDHHIHAAGCLHYENPTQGVHPPDMIRHILGEDLKVGCCLTWGPCFDYQKRFFTGQVAEESRYPYLLRYDVEVSGFGSHNSGHLNLLNLSEQIYPGGESKDHWPTLGLNTLRWAKRQGAVCGPAHSSIGLTNFIGRVPGTEEKDGEFDLPHYNIPAYDGIGANEFIMNVTHHVPGPDGNLIPAVDFISAMNTQRVAEWNMWYHVLNCGFRVAVSGETDFPCMSGERVGIGRVYAKVDGELSFQKWVKSIADGRSYVSDASCHLLDFQVTNPTRPETVKMGERGSELGLDAPQTLTFDLQGIAMREDRGEVKVELIVNGRPVESRMLVADGERRPISFETKIKESSWVAVRVFPHAHTNPVFITVDNQPLRASADSARWCLMGVEQCWKSKQPTYADDEQQQAEADYEHARQVYQKILEECLARE